jgi:hypothetical protein
MAAKIMIMPRDRLAWHKQMCEDRELSHVAFRVSVCISGYFNSQTGRTFVGYDRIADDLGIDRATVHRAVQQLRSKSDKNPAGRGHLDVTSGGGRHVANEYRMILKTVAPERRNDGDTSHQRDGMPMPIPSQMTLKTVAQVRLLLLLLLRRRTLRARARGPGTCSSSRTAMTPRHGLPTSEARTRTAP